jgi:3-deoxy-D-manno-octulosonic-acid transferase
MLTLYKIVVNAAYAILKPILALKRKKANVEWSQRCVLKQENYLPSPNTHPPIPQKTGLCLFHASSVGEIRVLERLVQAVVSSNPNLRYCISTYTRTGQELARGLFPNAEAVFYFPLDCYFPLKRFFNRFRPHGIVMVETEIWPYFLDYCRTRKVPLVLANGRLSSKSTNHYKLFRSGLSNLFEPYKKFIMQTDIDCQRMIAIGADPTRVMALGNIKHDHNCEINPEAKRIDIRKKLGIPDDHLLLVAASTRPGEEEIICRALLDLPNFPDKMSLLIAPRHLERLEEVIGLLNDAGFKHKLYSDLETGSQRQTPVILMDKIGVLAELFYGADLSFVGGTLADLGGHNIMEPVLAGVPVLFGPSLHNVKDAADQVIEQAQGMMIHNAEELASAIICFAEGSLHFEKVNTSVPSVAEQTAKIIIRELNL